MKFAALGPATTLLPLDHLDRLTDSTGLIQHAIYCIPRRESGYTTDDNARGLRLCTRLWHHRPDARMLGRITRYLSFLEYARGGRRGFHNFLGYGRDWLDTAGSADCQGQAVLALVEVLGSTLPDGYRAVAWELIKGVLPVLGELQSLRAQAYLIIAWGHLQRAGNRYAQDLEPIARLGAERLVECHAAARRPGWPWFESRLTYANAVLPQALYVAAEHWPDESYRAVAEATFTFLGRETTAEGVFWPVGNSDWYGQGMAKSRYDQQPIEAATMAEAALEALAVTGNECHRATFLRARGWFFGRNSLHQPLADTTSGGCFDGLQPLGVNRNQGAESTLALLWTLSHTNSARQAPALTRTRRSLGPGAH